MASRIFTHWANRLRSVGAMPLRLANAVVSWRNFAEAPSRLDGYRQALEEHFCITVTDALGRIVEANKHFCDKVGYPEAELLGKPYEMLSSGRRDDAVAHMWDVVNAGRTWRGEFCDRSKRGDEIWFELIVIPRFNADGQIDQFITISTDITEIREQSSTLRAMIDHAPAGVMLSDKAGRVLASNRLYRTLLQLPDELFGRETTTIEDLVRFRAERGDYGPEPVEAAVAKRLETLLSPVPIIEERNELTGKVLEIRCAPIPGNGHLNTYLDITERRHAELELRRANSTLEAFIKHAPAAVAMFDKDMRYVAHTERWLDDYKIAERDLIGRSHYDVFPEVPDHWKAKHRRVLAGATEASPEEEFLRADGSTNMIRWEVRPWYLEDRSIGGMMMLTEEISERKKIEKQLWQLAKFDSLTGLPNRLTFTDQLGMMIYTYAPSRTKFTVALIDVDHFKDTNDILGHASRYQALS